MRYLKVISSRRPGDITYVRLKEREELVRQLFEEFAQASGLSAVKHLEYFDQLAHMRLKLRDRYGNLLKSDPLLGDLCSIFVEWLVLEKDVTEVEATDVLQDSEARIDEFKFPY